MVHNASHGDRNSHSNSHHTPPLTDRLTRSLSFQPRCAKFIQVAAHSAPDDCWVSFHGDIYDITKLISENEGPLVQPLLKHAGSDISHWFDEVDGDVDETKENSETKVINLITHVDAVTNLRRPYTPSGGSCMCPRTNHLRSGTPHPKRLGGRTGRKSSAASRAT